MTTVIPAGGQPTMGLCLLGYLRSTGHVLVHVFRSGQQLPRQRLKRGEEQVGRARQVKSCRTLSPIHVCQAFRRLVAPLGPDPATASCVTSRIWCIIVNCWGMRGLEMSLVKYLNSTRSEMEGGMDSSIHSSIYKLEVGLRNVNVADPRRNASPDSGTAGRSGPSRRRRGRIFFTCCACQHRA